MLAARRATAAFNLQSPGGGLRVTAVDVGRSRRSARLNDVNWMRGDPDVKLPEPCFQLLLVTAEKLAMFRPVFHVHNHPHQIIAESLALMPPDPVDDLRFARNHPEALLQFQQSFGDQLAGHRLPVVKLQREQDFATTTVAHRWPGLPR